MRRSGVVTVFGSSSVSCLSGNGVEAMAHRKLGYGHHQLVLVGLAEGGDLRGWESEDAASGSSRAARRAGACRILSAPFVSAGQQCLAHVRHNGFDGVKAPELK